MKGGLSPTTRRVIIAGAAIITIAVVLLFWRPWLATMHINRARRMLRDRENEKALVELQSTLRLAPEWPETYLLLARAHRRMGQLDKVPSFLRRSKRLGADPERLQRESWLLMAQAGRLREAEPHLAELMIDPRDDAADILEAYVQGYFSNLRVSSAEQLLDVWSKQFPEDPKSHFMRAYLLRSTQEPIAAIDSYRKGLELDPENTLMRCQLSEVLIEVRRYDDAMTELERCLRESPSAPEILLVAAACHNAMGETEPARSLLEKLLTIEPRNFDARRELGELELSIGNFEAATKHLQVAVDERPYDITSHNALGRSLAGSGRADEALPHFQYVKEAEPFINDMERKISQISEEPDNVDLRCDVGIILLRYGSPEDGVKWLQTALELDPNHVRTKQALAGYLSAVSSRKN